MKENIKRLFHSHQWRTVKTDEVAMYYNGKEDGIEYVYIQECPICGKMRIYKFRS